MGWRWFWRGRTKWMRLESREGFGGCFMEREREKETEREGERDVGVDYFQTRAQEKE